MNDTVDLGKFSKGINNISPETDLPEGSLSSAINVDLDKEGNVYSRSGHEKVYSGSNIHSFYNGYFAEGSELKYFDGSEASLVSTGLSLTNYLAWEKILGNHYYSDGNFIKTVENGLAGILTPPNNPSLSVSEGLLGIGIYQVSICYIDQNMGEIGGSLISDSITVPDSGGILLNNIPVSPDGYDVAIFCSTQNGTELYQNTIVLNGTESFTIINSRISTQILNTQFMEPLPGGHIIRHFKARLYVANDNVLWFSEAFRYGLRKTAQDFFQFPEKITIVQPVDDGIYVVADKTYFLQGLEPSEMQQTIVSKHTAIEGTGLTMGGESFGLDNTPGQGLLVGFWYSNTGAMLGKAGGQLEELTDDRYAIPTGINSGSTLYRKKNGIKQTVTNFSNGGTSSGFAFGAQATSQIIRNGVVIP